MSASMLRLQASGLAAGERRSHLPSPPPLPPGLTELSLQSEQALRRHLSACLPAVSEIGSYLAEAGGKRLRPLLTALGSRVLGDDCPASLPDLMCVGELVHLGSLLHDDVVDQGSERRGKPSAHLVYGNASVVLAGDFCVSTGIRLAAEEGGPRAALELSRTVAAMSEGEILQLLHSGNFDAGLPVYLDIIRRKSALLIAWCVAAGAWSKGRDEEASALYSFGLEAGVAFQMMDDVLDYTGPSLQTGKSAARDLNEGKATLPLLLAMERRPQLAELLERREQEAARAEILQLVTQCGAVEAAREEAHRRILRGLTALDGLPEGPALDALRALGWKLVERVQ